MYKNFAQKLWAVSLCMAVVLLGVPVAAFAETVEHTEDGIVFSLDSDTLNAKVTGCTENLPADVVTPDSVTY